MTKTTMAIGAFVLMVRSAQAQDVKLMSGVDPVTDRTNIMAYSLSPDGHSLGWRCDEKGLLAVLVNVGPSY